MKLSVFYEHIIEAAAQENKSIDKICEKISSYNIEGLEIENTRLDKEREVVLKLLEKHHLSVSCIYGFFDFAHREGCADGERMIDQALELGCHKIMLIPGFLKNYEFLPFLYGNRVNRMVTALEEVCNRAEKKNITVVLEEFDGKEAPFATIKQLSYFMDEIENLYCTFDTGNFLYSEEDALDALPVFLHKIRHVHCKDRTFTVKEGETPKATVKGRNMYSSPVGSGCIPMKQLLNQIMETGYDDYLAIEHFGSLHQLADMKKSADWLNENF